jgi:STE24 endopeptidase
MRKFLIGLAGGLTLGYAITRGCDALLDLRSPAKAVDPDARAYGRTRRRLMLVGIVRTSAALAWTAFAVGPWLRSHGGSHDGLKRRVLWVVAGTLLSFVIDLPADYVDDHVLERRFGLSKQSANAWFADRIKALAVMLFAAVVLLELFVALARRAPRRWPLIATLCIGPLLVVANLIVPALILPLFNTFEPLTGPLEQRLRALAERYGVGDARILTVDMSRQTEKANAYVTGLLGMHRIVIGDTLLASFGDDEIEFVVAHELGHYVHRDVWRSVAVGTLASGLMLFVAGALARRAPDEPPGNLDALARLFFYVNVVGLALGPPLAALSRSREWAADRFAVGATAEPEAGARAFTRLRERNLAEDEQPRWMELLFSSHPSLGARIRALRAESVTPKATGSASATGSERRPQATSPDS